MISLYFLADEYMFLKELLATGAGSNKIASAQCSVIAAKETTLPHGIDNAVLNPSPGARFDGMHRLIAVNDVG